MLPKGFCRLLPLTAVLGAALAGATPARADLQLCNRTSYVVETAIGIEVKGSAATRGWLRADPGQCKVVLQGDMEIDRVYVYARALPVYGASPLALAGHADMCIAEGNFIIPGARHCEARQRLVRFTEVRPTASGNGPTVTLAEEAGYSAEQARRAGIQRLLAIAGYDAGPVDGIDGKKTEAALSQFLKDRGLAPEAALEPSIFDALAGAAKQADGTGFGWCNETSYAVMAALGLDGKDGIVTRGWYRIEPGSCLKPDMEGTPRRVYSYAAAVDAGGAAIEQAGKPLAWGGETTLCTRNLTFELADQKDCSGRGLTPAGFAMIDLAGRRGATVRFKEP